MAAENLTGTTVIYLETFQGAPGPPGSAYGGLTVEQVQDIVANLLRSSTPITLDYVDSANTLTIGLVDPFVVEDLEVTGTLRVRSTSQFDLGVRFGQDITLNEGQSIVTGTGTGSRFGSTDTQKIAFWGGTPRTKPVGWGTPTGTLNRATFVSDSVTLPSLAARVAVLISDLRSMGLI